MRNSEQYALLGIVCLAVGLTSGYGSVGLLAVGLWCLAINARNRETAAGELYNEVLNPIPLQLPQSLTAMPSWLMLILGVTLGSGGLMYVVRGDPRFAGFARGVFDVVSGMFAFGSVYMLILSFVRTAQEVRVQTAVDTFTPSASTSPLSQHLQSDGEMSDELAQSVTDNTVDRLLDE